MKIIKLAAENIKRLKAVEIVPEGNMVKITGRNEAGKSSVLDSILFALAGTKTIPEQPIRQGQSKASIRLELDDDLIVTRTFTPQNSYLKVENKQGATIKSPQAILDKLVGKLSFDPWQFAQADGKTQRDLLLQVIGLTVDPDELFALAGVVEVKDNPIDTLRATHKAVYEDRTTVNRELDRAKKVLASLPVVEPAQSVSVGALLQVRRQLEAQAKNAEQHNARFDQLTRQAQDLQEQCDRLRTALTEAEVNLQFVADQMAHWHPVNVPDFTTIDQRLANADAINQQAQVYAERQKAQDQVASLQAETDQHTARLQAIEDYQKALMAQAHFPIDGLTFAGNGVNYQGVPFSQASRAQKLQVSLAMAMALNPTLRVIRMSDGNFLDSEHMAIVEQMARDSDYQIWMELIEESGTVGVYIEDGEVHNHGETQ